MKDCRLWMCFILALFLACFRNSAPRLYDIPSGMGPESAMRLTVENLGLFVPGLGFWIEGRPVSDFDLEKKLTLNPEASTSIGFWEVDRANDEKPAAFLVAGPADVSLKPSGRIIGRWADGEPVLLLRSQGDWKLIADKRGHYAWIHRRSINSIPQGKILLDPASEMAKGYPKTLIEWMNNSVEEKIAALKESAASEDKAKLTETRSRFCPSDFTEVEQDGLVADRDVSPTRATLAELCGMVSVFRPTKKVRLKSEKCSCIHAQMGEVTPREVHSVGEFPPPSSNEKCSVGRYYVICPISKSCGEGCAPGVLACPIRCLEID